MHLRMILAASISLLAGCAEPTAAPKTTLQRVAGKASLSSIPVCGEASCVAASGAFVSHYNGAGCTGIETVYIPYFTDGTRRPWDGQGLVGTTSRTTISRSVRWASGQCETLWPSGNYLTNMAVVYRGVSPYCGEQQCLRTGIKDASHFTGANCTGTESYFTPTSNNTGTYDRRSWDGKGWAGTTLRTVTNRSIRWSHGGCETLWPIGNTLSAFVTIYRPSVTISGSKKVSRFAICEWYAQFNGELPNTYSWTVVQSPEPNNATVVGYMASSGVIRVQATDSEGMTASSTFPVTAVMSGPPTCQAP